MGETVSAWVSVSTACTQESRDGLHSVVVEQLLDFGAQDFVMYAYMLCHVCMHAVIKCKTVNLRLKSNGMIIGRVSNILEAKPHYLVHKLLCRTIRHIYASLFR